MFVIKVDDETNPIRDKNGFCITCKPGEKGLVVGIIGNKPLNQYNGYANNKSASEKKVIENLFKKGQTAFNSGKKINPSTFCNNYFVNRGFNDV
jgi:solute carrier family 27 fatty acid transporter 1/4